jgi:hypothetical protein
MSVFFTGLSKSWQQFKGSIDNRKTSFIDYRKQPQISSDAVGLLSGSGSNFAVFSKYLAITLLLLLGVGGANAQVAITSITTNYSATSSGTRYDASGAPGSPLSGDNFTYRFGTSSGTSNNILNFSSFGVGSNNYAYRNIPTAFVRIRRNLSYPSIFQQ